jgi:hypothetical protein
MTTTPFWVSRATMARLGLIIMRVGFLQRVELLVAAENHHHEIGHPGKARSTMEDDKDFDKCKR